MKRTLTLMAALVVMMLGVRTFAGTASADKASATPTTATTEKSHMSMSSKPMTNEDRVKHLDTKLNFTADQKEKVLAIFQGSQIQTLSDKINDKSLDKAAHQKAAMDMKTEMESVHKQIEPLLTDAQKVEFKKMMAGSMKNTPMKAPQKEAAPAQPAGTN